nr:Exodeoxyribonuclease 7 large subunit [Klebsiella pneumoniae]
MRLLLEREMGRVWISGEISNFSQPSSGHWYFTLKTITPVRCAMFRNSNRRVTFRPQHGQQVLVRANITLYEPRGDYQIIVESMQPAGEGLLQQKYEQLKAQLTAEGLFEQNISRRSSPPTASASSPRKPVRRCTIFSMFSGAAIRAAGDHLPNRGPGDDAPGRLCAPSRWPTRAECDVLIVGRGGGSLEDLWSFNDERVARAISASQILSSAPSAMKPTSRSLILLPTCGHRLPQPPRKSSAATSRSCCASCSPDSSGWKWRWTISSPVASAVLPSCSIACSNSIHSCAWPASRPPWNACASGCVSPWSHSLSAQNSGKSAPFCV